MKEQPRTVVVRGPCSPASRLLPEPALLHSQTSQINLVWLEGSDSRGDAEWLVVVRVEKAIEPLLSFTE